MAIVELAKGFATRAHGEIDQRRKYSNEPYINHPCNVVRLMSGGTLSDEYLAVGWLHDVLEDTRATEKDLIAIFPSVVVAAVVELTNNTRFEGQSRDRWVMGNYVKLRKASHLAQTVKCADIIDNVRNIVEEDPKFAQSYLAEKDLCLRLLTNTDGVLHRKATELVRSKMQQLKAKHGEDLI